MFTEGRGVFFAPTVLRLGGATLALRWVPIPSYRGLPAKVARVMGQRFALPGSANVKDYFEKIK